jgi:flagellum-specific peptidoglycan hydrolase FlgJ
MEMPKSWMWMIVCLASLQLSVTQPYTSPSVEETYIITYRQLAVQEMWRSGIPASIILAQAIVESESGTSELALKSNNHFGIKCTDEWRNETIYKYDDDRDTRGELVLSCFRAYDSVYESYVDHSEFLMHRKYYRHLFNYARTDYKRWATGLSQAGYATDPLYSQLLIETIEEFQLYYYDFLRPEQAETFPID